jgi:hypothetical protein
MTGSGHPEGCDIPEPTVGPDTPSGVGSANVAGTESIARVNDVPRPGVYRHYKGHFYQLLHIARDSENGPNEGRLLAVYVGLELDGARPGPRVCVRPIDQFTETLPDGRPRFAFVADEWDPALRLP